MSIQSTCPLCSNLAIVQARDDRWLVTCPVCLRFTLDPYLMDLFQSAPYRADEGSFAFCRACRMRPKTQQLKVAG